MDRRRAVRRASGKAAPLASLVIAALLLGSRCGTRFKERHYFASVDPVTRVPSNFFRMQVPGFAAFSTAQAITLLINRDEVQRARRAEAAFEVHRDQAASVATELEALIATARQDATPTAWLRILNAVAAALGATTTFDSFEEAAVWFQARRTAASAAPLP